jgi:PEGA domain
LHLISHHLFPIARALLLPRAGTLATVLSLTIAAVSPTVARAQSDAADASTTAMARVRFKEGVAFYDKGNFEKARASFLQAYALKRHPLVLINVAMSCLKSDHALEAARDFRQFLAEAKDITEQQRSDATDGLRQALSRVGQIEVSAEPGAEVRVDAEQGGTTPLSDTLMVEAGAHAVRIRARDGTTDTRQVVVAAGEKVTATFALARALTAPPPPSVAPEPPAPSAATVPPPQGPTDAPPPAALAPSAAATEPEAKPPQPLPNEPPSEASPSTLPLWPSYVGYALAAPAIAAAIYVGLKSESDAQTNANVTRSNILHVGGSCPTTSPAVSPSCAQYSNDLNLVSTDKTIGYALAGTGAALFAASTVWLIVGFVHNSQSPTMPSGAQAAFAIAPLLGPTGTGLAVFSKF